jgi:hypothetical protein
MNEDILKGKWLEIKGRIIVFVAPEIIMNSPNKGVK